MAKVRKKNNNRARAERFMSAIIRSQSMSVYNIDIGDDNYQGAINTKTLGRVYCTEEIADAILYQPHKWSVYISAFCDDGKSIYYKSKEIFLNGFYLSGDLKIVIEPFYRELVSSSNKRHIFGGGWIASPNSEELSEERAAAIFNCAFSMRKR